MTALPGPSRSSEQVAAGLVHLRIADPVLATLIDAHPEYDVDAWRHTLPPLDLFGRLVAQVTGQQISLRAAETILVRLSAVHGRSPTPLDLMRMDAPTLRALGLSWRKARTLLDLAARFTDGRLSEETLSRLDDEQIVCQLTEIPGIGPWTVQGALLIHLHREDVIPAGDIMLRNAAKKYYRLDKVPSEREFLELTRCWSPHGSLGVNLMFAAYELGWEPETATPPEKPQ